MKAIENQHPCRALPETKCCMLYEDILLSLASFFLHFSMKWSFYECEEHLERIQHDEDTICYKNQHSLYTNSHIY